MFEGLEPQDIDGAIEAMLFVTDVPVSTVTMADMLQVTPADIEAACQRIQADLANAQRGLLLTEVAGGWRLGTNPHFDSLLQNYVLSWDTKKLSQAALEVLAIVAYAQPVTRADISSIRGVNSDSSVNSLVEKGLLREAGTADVPGNPILYATSKAFLEKFGLRSIEDLPPLDEFAPDDETRDMIRLRLSATVGYIPSEEELTVSTKESSSTTYSEMLGEQLGVVEKIDFDDLEFSE